MKRLGWLLLIAAPMLAQVPVPQLGLTGNIGCQGFPCVNSGTLIMATDANHTMTVQETSAFYLKVTSSVSLTATRNLIAPAGRFPFTIENATTGGQSIQVIGASGTGVTIPNGQTVSVWNDGTNFVQIASNASTLLGYTWAVPGSIGSTTPNAGSFTQVTSGSSGVYSYGPIGAINPNAATSGNNYGSEVNELLGSYWNGSAAAVDGWTFQSQLGTGTNPTSQLNIIHTGSSGAANVFIEVPVGIPTYTVSGLPSATSLAAGTLVVVTDATSYTPGTCTGGGSDYVLAITNGTAWSCH